MLPAWSLLYLLYARPSSAPAIQAAHMRMLQQHIHDRAPRCALLLSSMPTAGAPGTFDDLNREAGCLRSSSMTALVYSMDEAAARLHKSRRWLQDWLRDNPTDERGQPYYSPLGRTKTFDDNDLERIRAAAREEERCRLSSSRRVRAKRRSGAFAAPTSDATLTEALALAKRHSPKSSLRSSGGTPNVVRLAERRQSASQGPT